MIIVAVKKYCTKNGKTYGPYPKGPEYYLYRVFREGDQVKQEYLGKGPKPLGARELRKMVQRDMQRQMRYLEYLKTVVQENTEGRLA